MMAVNLFRCGICLEDVRIPAGKQVSDYKQSNLAFTGDQALSDTLEPVATKCNHVYHSSCLKTWIDSFLNKTSAASCPECREELLSPDISISQSEEDEGNRPFAVSIIVPDLVSLLRLIPDDNFIIIVRRPPRTQPMTEMNPDQAAQLVIFVGLINLSSIIGANPV